jgi:hypothetical protein
MDTTTFSVSRHDIIRFVNIYRQAISEKTFAALRKYGLIYEDKILNEQLFDPQNVLDSNDSIRLSLDVKHETEKLIRTLKKYNAAYVRIIEP